MNGKVSKKVSRKAKEFALSFLKERLTDEEANKLTYKHIEKTEYAGLRGGACCIVMCFKVCKNVLKRIMKYKDIDLITVKDVKVYCDRVGRN